MALSMFILTIILTLCPHCTSTTLIYGGSHQFTLQDFNIALLNKSTCTYAQINSFYALYAGEK